ncbi:hypothetical protein ABW636_02640 [Aquimarina sp. 2201CG1-2-11]|uniref:hypothetical protein n=1 Tax=Aquimarina discodermiae TaxID=3231043 RepID=UPI003462FFA9
MLKSILKLDGAKTLNKTQQKNVFGGSHTGLTSEDGKENSGDLHCYCSSGGVYKTGHCKWCGWFCGASAILKCE